MQQQFIQMEKKPNKLSFQSALAYSLYFLILTYIFSIMGINPQDPNSPVIEKVISYALTYIPFILAVLYVQTRHKQELNGYITFGGSFSAGFKVAAYTGLFLFVLLIVYYKFLNKSAMDEIISVALQNAESDQNKMKGIEMMKPYMAYFIGFGAAVSYTIFGLILSLISAAILKNEKPLHIEEL